MNRSRRSWIFAALALALTFGLGVVTGGGIVNAVVNEYLEEWRSLSTAEGFAARVSTAIGPLPGHQRAAMDRILIETGKDLAVILVQRRSEYGVRLDEMERQLSEILAPSQLEGWLRVRAKDLENAKQRLRPANGK